MVRSNPFTYVTIDADMKLLAVVVADMGLSVRLEKPDQKLYARCGSLGYTAPE